MKSASDFYAKLSALLGKETDLASRRALAQSNFELAELTRRIGRPEAALAAHQAVLAAREALAADSEADAGMKADVGRSLTAVAYVLSWNGKTAEALVAYRRSESLLAGLAGSDPAARAALAACRARMTRFLLYSGKSAEALVAGRLAKADQAVLAAAPGASNDARRDLAATANELGIVLWDTGKIAEAEAELRSAVSIQQALADENPAVTEFGFGLTAMHIHFGRVLSLAGKQAEAELRTALAISRKLMDRDPAVTLVRRSVAVSRNGLGHVLCLAGKHAQAEAELRTALAIVQKLADENPRISTFREDIAIVQTELGVVLLQMGNPAEAEARLTNAVAILQGLADDNRAVATFDEHLARALSAVGDVVRSLGRAAAAKGSYERAIALKEPRVHEDATNTEHRYVLICAMRRRGLALRDLGDLAGAAADIRRALALCDGPPPRSAHYLFEIEMACCHAALAGLAGRVGRGLGGRGGNCGRQGDGMATPGGCHGLPKYQRTPDRVGPGPAPQSARLPAPHERRCLPVRFIRPAADPVNPGGFARPSESPFFPLAGVGPTHRGRCDRRALADFSQKAKLSATRHWLGIANGLEPTVSIDRRSRYAPSVCKGARARGNGNRTADMRRPARSWDNPLLASLPSLPGSVPVVGFTRDNVLVRGHVMSAAADRHLLFGMLAVQNGLIDQVQLVAAFQAWTRDKARSFADRLEDRGDLDADDRAVVDALVARHLKRHGSDIEKSLAHVAASRSTRESLAILGDPDIEATLGHVGSARAVPEHHGHVDADRTTDYPAGATTSEGPRFRILRPHARDGLGEAFVALDAELHREVVLKQILEKHADHPASRQRFIAEAEITGGLEHPGIGQTVIAARYLKVMHGI